MALNLKGKGLELSSDLRPINGAPIGLMADEFLIRGFRAVQDIAERDSIPASRMSNGMHVYVIDTDTLYVLIGGLWVEKLAFDQAVADLNYINRSKIVQNKAPVEAVDGITSSFTTGDAFDLSGGLTVRVVLGGMEIHSNFDFDVVQSGGAGTNYDTVSIRFVPESGTSLFLSYTKL